MKHVPVLKHTCQTSVTSFYCETFWHEVLQIEVKVCCNAISTAGISVEMLLSGSLSCFLPSAFPAFLCRCCGSRGMGMKDLKLHFQVVKLLLLIPNSVFKLMKAFAALVVLGAVGCSHGVYGITRGYEVTHSWYFCTPD